jgi:hypothetical protein
VTATFRDPKAFRQFLGLCLRATLLTFLIVAVIHSYVTFGFDWARPEGDPWNYLAAGERLNEGHPLYALSPGDRPVILRPPWWSVPLLAPPPIAVFWRPLALLGDLSMYVWGLAGAIAVVGSALYVARRGALYMVAILAQPLALTALSGNFSGFLLGMLIAAWVFRDRPWVVGGIIAAAAAIKLTPIVLIVWLAGTGRWRAVVAVLVCGVAIGLVALVGAGPSNFIDWIRSVPTSRPSPIALSTLTGLPTYLIPVLLTIPVLLAWGRDRLAFGLAVVATALATPALYFTAVGLLAALPVWRQVDRFARPGTATEEPAGLAREPAA